MRRNQVEKELAEDGSSFDTKMRKLLQRNNDEYMAHLMKMNKKEKSMNRTEIIDSSEDVPPLNLYSGENPRLVVISSF